MESFVKEIILGHLMLHVFFEFQKKNKLPLAAGKNAYFPLSINTPQGSRTFW